MDFPLVVVLVFASMAVSHSQKYNTVRVTVPSARIDITASIHTRSRLDCISQCVAKFSSRAFIYSITKHPNCRCASGFYKTQPPKELSKFDDLYVREDYTFQEICEEVGFELHLDGKVCISAHSANIRRTYVEARSECTKFPFGRLFMHDSEEKLRLRSYSQWTGLDDIEIEDSFVWADGRNMTTEERGLLFRGGEPDDYNDSEDCVIVWNWRMRDSSCEELRYYDCEIAAF